MKLSKAVEKALNEQINMEFLSAYSYLAMSAFCERIFFTGTAKWLRQQSQEEKDHGMKLYEFMRNRNARIELLALPAPSVDYDNVIKVFEKSLENEIAVSESINRLYELCLNEKAFSTAVELNWFLIEQVEEEKTARDILAKLQLVKDDPAALLEIDKELGQRVD